MVGNAPFRAAHPELGIANGTLMSLLSLPPFTLFIDV
jgi:hypothetical protein